MISKNVSLRRGTKVVLDSVNTTINPGEHVGLIGRNGAANPRLPCCRALARRWR